MTDQRRERNIYRPLTIPITDQDGAAIDLSSLDEGAVVLTMRRLFDGDLLVDHVETSWVTDGSDAKVQYQFAADELDATSAGTYEIQLEILWPAGAQNVVITDQVEVAEHYGTHPS